MTLSFRWLLELRKYQNLVIRSFSPIGNGWEGGFLLPLYYHLKLMWKVCCGFPRLTSWFVSTVSVLCGVSSLFLKKFSFISFCFCVFHGHLTVKQHSLFNLKGGIHIAFSLSSHLSTLGSVMQIKKFYLLWLNKVSEVRKFVSFQHNNINYMLILT